VNVQLRGQRTQVSEAFRAHAERCLEFALRRFANRIDRVSVWLADVNGPRGGVDKRCRVAVRLRSMGSAVVAKTASDASVAVSRAAGLVGWAVSRKIAREQERRPDRCERGRNADRPALMQPEEEG
jgi:ribosome hibernation promoting factor